MKEQKFVEKAIFYKVQTEKVKQENSANKKLNLYRWTDN